MRLRWLLLGLAVAAPLVVAPAITTARLLDPPGGLWVRLVAFTPHASALYLLAFLLLLLAVARGRRFWRGLASLLATAALVGVVVHVGWSSGPFVGDPGTSGASAARSNAVTPSVARVMTSNLLFGRADVVEVLDAARRHQVDVLVAQEVTPRALVRLEQAGLDGVLPHRAGRPAAGPAGTMVFSRGPLSAVRTLATGFGSYTMRVRLPSGGTVRLVAVHARPPTGDARAWRADQRAVRTAARGLAGPALVVGDLNATIDHAPLRELRGRGYLDAATAAASGWQPTWPANGLHPVLGVPVPRLLAIDHVLARELRPVWTDTVAVPGTDHRALVAVLGR